ncbi:putative aarF domain-containing protein kinase [Acorus calamus]|uniref:AarF domain-containing protein kinase n=1 Tax=Acorus calamus TaxID=4465 RepID=A0AAV9C5V2_ACOCL|nr:putative aarF domain-containing protein kinase [Acorus calamus]
MEASPQLLCCGSKPFSRALSPPAEAVFNPRGNRGRRSSGSRRLHVVAVATEPKPTVKSEKKASPKTSNGAAVTRFGNVSADIKRVRAQMEEDEQLASLMRGLRGQNLSDSQFADENVQLRLVEVTESGETLPLVYDPAVISQYWGKRPRAVATRIVQLLSVAGGFLSGLAGDVIQKKVKENEVARAIELREIVTSLGPAYIKLGQALSIRPDILSPAAMTELQKLCDKVPSFPDDVAMALIEEELGQPWQNFYSELSPSPIAAAYSERQTIIFSDRVKLKVVVPKTYHKYTSRKVLTTSWIEGEKLSQSTESDVGELVNVGVICYLKQLLDTGFFHADPHPGNMIRTPDGKLAILDFGLVTRLTDDQKYGLIEAIAHLIHRDYAAIVKDFVKLDFIPDGVNLEPILPVLAKVFDQALEGGGAKNINFQELASDLAQITFDYPFRIPPYFALIIRAIGVLEGIALVGNPEFAIVDEAYPYIAQIAVTNHVYSMSFWSQRLLTDDSPRLRSALRYTIYGKSGVFDAERFIDVMQAFENFITAAKSGGGEELNGDMADLGISPGRSNSLLPPFPLMTSQSEQPIQTRAALNFLLSDKGNFFREFILDEIVKSIDALSRAQLIQITAALGIRNSSPVFSMVPLRTAALLPTITEEDKVTLNNVEKVAKFLTSGTSKSNTFNENSSNNKQRAIPQT